MKNAALVTIPSILFAIAIFLKEISETLIIISDLLK